MARCDSCNRELSRGTGLLVPGSKTADRAVSEAKQIFSILGLGEDDMKAATKYTGDQMAASPSLVCDSCANGLDLSPGERAAARTDAAAWWRAR